MDSKHQILTSWDKETKQYLRIMRRVETIGYRRPRNGLGMCEPVRISPIGEGRVISIAGTMDLEHFLIVFVIVMHIKCDLVEVFLQIRDGAPHY